MNEKKLNIQFAPGCFDHFEGTQEELDEMVAEIQSMFENLTPEDLEAQSRPVCIDDLLEDDDISDDQFEQMLSALVGNSNRTLQ